MAVAGWIALMFGTATLTWLVVAFGFHWRQDARCATTVLVPVVILSALVLRYFMAGEASPCTSECMKWRPVFVVASLVAGSFAALASLPIWLLMEQRLGGGTR